MMTKGEKITVDSGKKRVNCVLVDIDHANDKIWVRTPTGAVVVMKMNAKSGMYEGQIAGIELRVDPSQN
jgi:hypothetical protein